LLWKRETRRLSSGIHPERAPGLVSPLQYGNKQPPHVMIKKALPYLVIAGVAIAAVYVWNSFISPKLLGGKFQA